MSKFIDKIVSQWTKNSKAVYGPLRGYFHPVDDSRLTIGPHLQEYEFGVEWKARHYCMKEEVDYMLRAVTSQLRQDVYGDFGDLLLKFEIAMYEYDQMKMREIMTEMKKLVFGENFM